MPIRIKNRFDPQAAAPYKLSRSKLEMFLKCPKCFYVDRRLGVDRVTTPPFTLNSATDVLLKKEFDIHRNRRTPHPIMSRNQLNLVPYADPRLDDWRNNFRGVQYLDPNTNLLIYGAIDDLWLDRDSGMIHVVDYKSTSTTKPITLDDRWKESYKRQLEIYQWLLRRNNLTISNRCYFVYVNALTACNSFDDRLKFDMQLIPYEANDQWVESAIGQAWDCLRSARTPASAVDCEWCDYRDCVELALNQP